MNKPIDWNAPFRPEDFSDFYTEIGGGFSRSDEACAFMANRRFRDIVAELRQQGGLFLTKEQIEKCPVVHGNPKDGKSSGWSEYRYPEVDTHQARLICIEEAKKDE